VLRTVRNWIARLTGRCHGAAREEIDVHAPDGFLDATTAIATGVLSAGAVAVALRRSREELSEQQVPVAGLAAAFVFAAQMVNFPIAAGTTGHLLGGALAAVLLGPSVGLLVVTVVVAVQALIFADGGLTALGYNVLNMAVVTSLGGWAVFRSLRSVLPRSVTGVAISAGIAGFVSVVLSSAAFSLEWLFGATVAVPFDRVFLAMVGVHSLIGIGEGVITGLTVAAVVGARPDLVVGARDLAPGSSRPRRPVTPFVAAGLGVSLLVAVGVAQFAGDDPDGLERVAEQVGFADTAEEHRFSSSLFADYATDGVRNDSLSLALAGAAGTLLTLLVGSGLFLAIRRRDVHGRSHTSVVG
jgi:cobalt/nickel transport system permease protein